MFSLPRSTRNPPNRFLDSEVDWEGDPPLAQLELREERAKSALQENRSPDVGFRWSVNPYRGCYHACAYCYARPTHEYLGWGAGTDFDRRIVVKTNLPEVLSAELSRPSWRGELVVFSGNTDCYQPLEAARRLTRRALEVCLAHENPVGIVTKGALVQRDIDILAKLNEVARAQVFISVPVVDEAIARALEPGASPPARRFEALAQLSAAGIPTGVMVSPLIPGLNDAGVPEVLRRAKDAGARWASMTLLRLPGSVRQVFVERLRETLPTHANKVLGALKEMRGGRMNDPSFGARMRGQGQRWEAVANLFRQQARRLGFEERGLEDDGHATPQRRGKRQLKLF